MPEDRLSRQNSISGFPPHDILPFIFSELHDAETRSHLRNAASVCSLWRAAIQSELWRQPPVVELFSQLAPLKRVRSYTIYLYEFTSPLDASQWDSFAAVAKYVRVLDSSWKDSHPGDFSLRLHPSAWDQISQTCPWPYALPSLQELRILAHSDTFPPLLSPGLTVLRVQKLRTDEALGTLIFEAIDRMKGLREFSLEPFVFSYLQQGSGSDVIRPSWQALETLSLDLPSAPICLTLFRALADVPNIKHVTLQLSCDEIPDEYLQPATQSELSSLQTLRLRNMPGRVAAAVIASFFCSQMHDLRVVLDGPCEQEVNEVLFAKIANACPALRVLNIEQLGWGNPLPSGQGYEVDGATMLPIINNLRLEHFSITHKLPLDLDPSDISNLAQKWGHSIQHLSLNPAPGFSFSQIDDRPLLDPACLEEIGRNCPHLTHLGICLTFNSHTLSRPFSTPIFSAALTCIDFGSSEILHDPSESLPFFRSLKAGPLRLRGVDLSEHHFNASGSDDPVFWETVDKVLQWGDCQTE